MTFFVSGGGNEHSEFRDRFECVLNALFRDFFYRRIS